MTVMTPADPAAPDHAGGTAADAELVSQVRERLAELASSAGDLPADDPRWPTLGRSMSSLADGVRRAMGWTVPSTRLEPGPVARLRELSGLGRRLLAPDVTVIDRRAAIETVHLAEQFEAALV